MVLQKGKGIIVSCLGKWRGNGITEGEKNYSVVYGQLDGMVSQKGKRNIPNKIPSFQQAVTGLNLRFFSMGKEI